MASRPHIFLLFILFPINLVVSHIPLTVEWAEPDGSYSSVESFAIGKEESEARLASLRAVMSFYNVDAYIIPTADAHGSQYIAPTDARREWISGFTGSAGSALVTMTEALLFTDARYFLQFDLEVDPDNWKLMRPGIEPSTTNWLVGNMLPNTVVAVDPTTYTRNEWVNMQSALNQVNVTLVETVSNLVDIARENHGDPAPPRPNEPLIPLTRNYTGKSAQAKVADLMEQIRSRNAVALILSALDDIAYTLNLRGSDIPYNPVFFSYLILRADLDEGNNIIFFWGEDGVLPQNVIDFLRSEDLVITAQPYDSFFDYLSQLATEVPGGTIWLTQTGSQALYSAVESNGAVTILTTLSPVALMKAIKNEVELEGFRNAHIKDGIAVVRALRWVHEQVDNGVNVTEVDMSNKLIEFRRQEADFMGPSFNTIAGTGSNGAIIHYSPSEENQRVVEKTHMFLVDSGAQYKDGTTDITRTRHMSYTPTEEQRLAFTRVLKGQILLGTAVFPRGILGKKVVAQPCIQNLQTFFSGAGGSTPERSPKGNVLETLARKSLWDVGLNYGHGTGHGVGHFLNVHEGPSGILSSPIATDPGISAGMVFSNEPGYYEEGEYGIRHEDLVEVIELNNDADHIRASGLVGDFGGVGALGFRYLSLAPHQTSCLDIDLLTEFEIEFINTYHARVLSTLGPILLDRDLLEDYAWLEKECAPISRSAAILLRSSPFLALFTVVSVFFRN